MKQALSLLKGVTMGDRVNIEFMESFTESLWLYSHWGARYICEYLQDAMNLPEAKNRYSDESYLNRIVIQHILDRAGFSETGWGISVGRQWPDYPHHLRVNHMVRKIQLVNTDTGEVVDSVPFDGNIKQFAGYFR